MFAKLIAKCTTKIEYSNANSATENNPHSEPPLYGSFKLPIAYLPSTEVHPIHSTLASDLELTTCVNSDQTAIYDILFQPKHEFAKMTIKEWAKQYTSNIDFLKDSQVVLTNIPRIVGNKSEFHYQEVQQLWNSVKMDKYFMEKYSYIEWGILEYLNKSSSFLQSLSIIHLISPILTLLMPLVLLLIPFVLLKIQGVPLTLNTYFAVLRDIAKSHFIGKAIGSMTGKFDITNVAYFLMICAFFVFQMYQNIISFYRFYNNMKSINVHLCNLKTYLKYTIHNMDSFVSLNTSCATYTEFCKDVSLHSHVLKEFMEKVEHISCFSISVSKFNSMGYMMKSYYDLHSNPNYDASLRYSFGFEGYYNNLVGAYSHVLNNTINNSSYNTNQIFELKDQYYISHFDGKHVKNNFKMDKNIIITGVNASGKTTMLKSITLNILFSQQIGYGFYKKCKLHPYTNIHSYLNIPDTSGRDSLFQAESRRCKEIIDCIGDYNHVGSERHFCIFDELYSGTNPSDAIKSSFAFLSYLSKYSNVDFILTTHYSPVCMKFEEAPHSNFICNYKMDVDQGDNGKLNFSYKLKPGICNIHGAIEILKEMEYPDEIIDSIMKFDSVKTETEPDTTNNENIP
jgi:hypothetical protein